MLDENKTFLFITHSYPSINSANSLCVQKLIENRPNDITPIVLCYRFPGQKKHEVVDGIEIHRIKKDWFWPIEGLARYPSRSNRFNRLVSKIITKLRQIIYLPIFPVYDVLAARNIKKAACKITSSKQIQSVFADFNGCDTLMGGYECCKINELDFYPIFWDYLFDGFPSKYVTRKFNDKRKKKLETKILSFSKKTIMLDTIEENIRHRYSADNSISKKLIFIGIPAVTTNNSKWTPTKSKSFSFLFGGSLEYRNLEPLLKAINGLNIPIDFDVYSGSYCDKSVESLQKKYSFLKLHSPLSSSDFISKCYESDFLVNLGVKNPNAIPSKLYLYFSTCKPVINSFSIGNDPCLKAIKNYRLGYAFNEKSPDAHSLKAFIFENKGKKMAFDEVNQILKKNAPLYFWQQLNIK